MTENQTPIPPPQFPPLIRIYTRCDPFPNPSPKKQTRARATAISMSPIMSHGKKHNSRAGSALEHESQARNMIGRQESGRGPGPRGAGRTTQSSRGSR